MNGITKKIKRKEIVENNDILRAIQNKDIGYYDFVAIIKYLIFENGKLWKENIELGNELQCAIGQAESIAIEFDYYKEKYKKIK